MKETEKDLYTEGILGVTHGIDIDEFNEIRKFKEVNKDE